MSYRKLRADRIFDGYGFIDERVLIVSADGVIQDLVATENAGVDIETLIGTLVPGFINCHCHLELSHMRGVIREKTGLVDFVFKVVTERHHSEDEILQAIEKAEQEMLQNGTVAVGDICNNSLTVHQKRKSRIAYYNFIEASGWLPSVSTQRVKRSKTIAGEFATLGAPWSIVPHAPYSVSGDLWEQIQPYFDNKVVSIHNQETPFEDEFFQKGSGDFNRMYQLMKIDNSHHVPTERSSLQSYFHRLQNAQNAILVHNTFMQQQDVDYIQIKNQNSKPATFICLCVNANLYIEDVLPPIKMFRNNNCTIVLGTDSLASNWTLNILDEIKTIRKSFPAIPLQEPLSWATINGARALNMDHRLGSFEKGKMPGVLLLDEERLTAKKII
jgi:cytosine/adenosine deaminase-related metal-dependent hydrolase